MGSLIEDDPLPHIILFILEWDLLSLSLHNIAEEVTFKNKPVSAYTYIALDSLHLFLTFVIMDDTIFYECNHQCLSNIVDYLPLLAWCLIGDNSTSGMSLAYCCYHKLLLKKV